MFGQYDIPLNISDEGIFISIEKDGKNLIYKRDCVGDTVEKLLLSENNKIVVNPVEPLNKPKELTPNLLIEFEKKVLIDPEAKRKIYLKFPIEIGVFLFSNKKNYEILDIITLSKMKYTLYGSITKGMICKYWKSDIYFSFPSLNPIYEGGLELNIKNETSDWINVTKVILNAYFMKIYYGGGISSIKANMEIVSPEIAETSVIDRPFKKGMEKSLELYSSRRIPVVITKFVMEDGF